MASTESLGGPQCNVEVCVTVSEEKAFLRGDGGQEKQVGAAGTRPDT